MHTRQLLLEQALLLWAVNRDSFHGAYPDSPLPLVCLAVVKPQVLAPLATAEDVESDMQQGDQVMDAQERGDIGIWFLLFIGQYNFGCRVLHHGSREIRPIQQLLETPDGFPIYPTCWKEGREIFIPGYPAVGPVPAPTSSCWLSLKELKQQWKVAQLGSHCPTTGACQICSSLRKQICTGVRVPGMIGRSL